MGVRDCIFCSIVCYSLRVTFRYTHFIYCIADSCSGCVLRKSCPCVAPVVCFIQHYRIPNVFSVCFQLHADACRADSVLVVTVGPDFSYAYFCGITLFTIRNFYCSCFFLISWKTILMNFCISLIYFICINRAHPVIIHI